MMTDPSIISTTLLLLFSSCAHSFSTPLNIKRNNAIVSKQIPGSRLSATIERDGLFWPSLSKHYDSNNKDVDDELLGGDFSHDPNHYEEMDEQEYLMTMTLDSVLKIYATHSEPDFLIPWQKRHQTTSTSSGFVIDVPGIGLRVMTNAHSVEYGSVVQVQKRGEDEKHAAVVEAVGNECDLALLRVDSLFPPPNEDKAPPEGVRNKTSNRNKNDDDENLTYALPLGPLPALQDEVEVLGYPMGGDSLCVTKGVVSRIEMQEYAQAGARLLAIQIDAAINPGNSGGPVVNEEMEVIGVAFQGIDEESIENVGYVVPVSVMRHFLEDVRRHNGNYTGFCHLGVDICFLENVAFRNYLKLGVNNEDYPESVNGAPKRKKRVTGVMVRRVQPTSGSYGILRNMDVIMAVDGIPVGNDGKIPFRRGERVDLSCYVSSLFDGDEARVTIWREGNVMDVQIPLLPVKHLVPSHFNNKPPPYLICSGFVFTALSVPYLNAKGAWDDYYTDNVSYLLGLANSPLEKDGDEVVVLAQVLAHKANLGYENYVDLHLIKFNDVEVRCLRHLHELISESTGPFMKFEFAPKEGGRLIVLDRALNDQATNDVCAEHSISTCFVSYDSE
mmetsp:Transcript_1402/g.2862  ORF Transcript_1402/g.2862 Transcript_1402/m.2862 type:complete len:614 (+) Transcript_1402:72-1913(+)